MKTAGRCAFTGVTDPKPGQTSPWAGVEGQVTLAEDRTDNVEELADAVAEVKDNQTSGNAGFSRRLFRQRS